MLAHVFLAGTAQYELSIHPCHPWQRFLVHMIVAQWPALITLQVFTSDIRGAGTDANVTIILFGANGLDTGKIKLENSKNNFERGQVGWAGVCFG